jgi:hypothetical protein
MRVIHAERLRPAPVPAFIAVLIFFSGGGDGPGLGPGALIYFFTRK